ncbi:glycosyltransferase involved in cell wall biosynthesis [Oceanihabitans sediminis]|uniref:Glycosyltransferase family 2 protein n=1 Tax=Oceanihabitans sediminis TaxID=1812012 RepID=A0A368P4V1_9FLAO|nr:glycosyltransferase family 2 protein [Oceanihabitans sediminis]RBP26597.1 glycosyltransferase involved in cell wall biosynthesis [Oceanihabitans sediminis]RCU57114.1 glycosyltransferase family 2 protein [Oceanihabitans sediminis]
MIISVALCTYNGEKYIKEQLDSIINQTYQVDEIIVCDDSSTDKTLQILKEYAFQYPNLISVFDNKTNLRTIKNFEKAISLTNGDLIFLADQDDIWKTSKVEIIVDYYKNTKNFKLVFTNGDLIDDKGNLINSTLWDEWGFSKERRKLWLDNDEAYKDLVLNKNKITGATVCINKSIKSNAIPIFTPDGYWHDAWLGLHAAAQGGLYFIEQSLILYRIHESQQIGISKKTKEIDIPKKTSSVSKNEFYSYLNRLYPNKSNLLPIFKKKSFIEFLKSKFSIL